MEEQHKQLEEFLKALFPDERLFKDLLFTSGRPRYYFLEGKEVIPVTSNEGFINWSIWFETAERSIGREEIKDLVVSTVFLGLDHSYSGAPILFETMVFGGPMETELCARYETYDEALAGHKEIIEEIKAARPDRRKGFDMNNFINS